MLKSLIFLHLAIRLLDAMVFLGNNPPYWRSRTGFWEIWYRSTTVASIAVVGVPFWRCFFARIIPADMVLGQSDF